MILSTITSNNDSRMVFQSYGLSLWFTAHFLNKIPLQPRLDVTLKYHGTLGVTEHALVYSTLPKKRYHCDCILILHSSTMAL